MCGAQSAGVGRDCVWPTVMSIVGDMCACVAYRVLALVGCACVVLSAVSAGRARLGSVRVRRAKSAPRPRASFCRRCVGAVRAWPLSNCPTFPRRFPTACGRCAETHIQCMQSPCVRWSGGISSARDEWRDVMMVPVIRHNLRCRASDCRVSVSRRCQCVNHQRKSPESRVRDRDRSRG